MALGAFQAHLCIERFAPFVDIDQSEHRKHTVGVLGQTSVAHFGKAPDTLECEKRVLDLCSCLTLGAVDLFVSLSQWLIAIRAFEGANLLLWALLL
jgi:hypothetical protein